jgi:tetratricopeptide (TPR) repeat protein
MARSFYRPTRETTVGKSGGPITYYHEPTRMHYSLIERTGNYYQQRWRVDFDGKKTDSDEFRIDFIMGSGSHARSYLHREANGALVELPLAWYSEKGGYWALNPGYDTNRVAPQRQISYDCMFCHNSYPQIPAGHSQLNREPLYADPLPEGIDCQRCHGPGARHVKAAEAAGAQAGDLRATIFNPSTLSGERQMEVCMQCHLETTSSRLPSAIRRFDRGPFSFRAGERLGDFSLNFDKAPGRREENLGIVDSAHRLRQSQCWIHSQDRLTCLTCHDPHSDLHTLDEGHYNGICLRCHASRLRELVNADKHTTTANCIDCHMPKRRTNDVVHVVMTDHRIQARIPSRDLLGEVQEAHAADHGAYRGEVVPYYPDRLPDNNESRLSVAVAQVTNGSNLSLGVQQLASAIKQERPRQAQFYFALGEAWRDLGMPAKAVLAYQEAVRREPASGWMLKRLADALLASGNLPKALLTMRQATTRWPDDSRIHYSLGALTLASGSKTEAISILRKSIQLDPDLPYAHQSLGRALLDSSNLSAAEEEFRSELRVQPDFSEARVNLATLLSTRGNFSEASYYFDTALALNPENVGARCNYAIALLKLDRPVDARDQIERAVVINTSLPMPHQILGEILEEQGELQQAIDAYRQALLVKPGFSPAHLDLGRALLKQGLHGEAVRELRKAMSASDRAIRNQAAQALQDIGERR